MSYESSPACQLLATQCCVCGRPLVDAISVSLGIGPDCRQQFDGGISPEQQDVANQLTYQAAIAAEKGDIEEVRQIASRIKQLGLIVLAEKVGSRFVNVEKKVKIRIHAEGMTLRIETPYKRSVSQEFIAAWQAIPGRRFDRSTNSNVVPSQSKNAVWQLLRRFFPGEFAKGPKGLFRIPNE